MSVERNVAACYAGSLDYADALALQERCVHQRKQGGPFDRLLMVEHPPVITLGRSFRATSNLLVSPDVLSQQGVSVVEVGRGGDATYHGPGQLVVYPIVDLRPDRCDVRRYVRDLEEVMIDALGQHGVAAHRIEGLQGAWVDSKHKIGAVGVRVSQWVTMHGFSINLAPDLSHFDWIVPCGLVDYAVTSVAEQSLRVPSMDEFAASAAQSFCRTFGARLTWLSLEEVERQLV